MNGSHDGATDVVLVVEDNPLLQMTTVDVLIDSGFHAISASNADEAIGVLETRRDVCAVFTDIDMPGSMDGIELVAAVRRRWPAIRTVVTSGGPPPAGWAIPPHVHYHQKPYDRDLVVASLRGEERATG